MQLDSVHGLDVFLVGSGSGDDEVTTVGITAHRRDKSKSESMM